MSSFAVPRGKFISCCVQAVRVAGASTKAAKARAGALAPQHLPASGNLSVGIQTPLVLPFSHSMLQQGKTTEGSKPKADFGRDMVQRCDCWRSPSTSMGPSAKGTSLGATTLVT